MRASRRLLFALTGLAAVVVTVPVVAAEALYLHLVDRLGEPPPTPVLTSAPPVLTVFWVAEEERLPPSATPLIPLTYCLASLFSGPSRERPPGLHMAHLAARRWTRDRIPAHARGPARGILSFASVVWVTRHWTAAQMTQAWIEDAWFGRGAYGLERAALAYFGKRAEDLELHELALLAGLPQSPSRFSPSCHPERALSRREYVLRRLLAAGAISASEHGEALARPLGVIPVACE